MVLGVGGFATLSGRVVTDHVDLAMATNLPPEQAAAITDDAQAWAVVVIPGAPAAPLAA